MDIYGEWTEADITETREVFAIGQLGTPSFDELVGLMLTVPDTRPFLRVEPVDSDEVEANFKYLLGGSRIFVNRKKIRDLRGDVYAAFAVWALSHSWTWTAGVALFRKTVDAVRVLDGQDRVIVGTLARLSAEANSQPVPAQALESVVGGDVSTLRKRVASLAERGVITKEDGGWQLTP